MAIDKKSKNTRTRILLGCLLLVALLGVALFARELNEQPKTIADLMGVDVIIIPKAAENYASQFVFSDVEKPLYLPPDLYENLRNEPEVARMTFHIHLGKPPPDCCTYIDGPIIAFEEKSDFIISPLIAERRKKGLLAKHEIFEGGAIHDYLGLVTDIDLLNKPTKIVGHLKHTNTNFDNCVFMRAEDIATIPSEYLPNYPQDGISVIYMQLNAGTDVSKFSSKIQNDYAGISTISKRNFFEKLKAVLVN